MGLVGELPDAQRAAVLARVVEERGYADLAAGAGVSEVVMRKRVSRGLATMRARIGGGR
jgi:RNA polymerase sigma-70 factor (ECF subfamily)